MRMKQIDSDVELSIQLSQKEESEAGRDWKVLTNWVEPSQLSGHDDIAWGRRSQ